MKIFVLDNYDSFTYNLVHILEQFATYVEVKRNDSICVKDIVEFDKIVFSPGPGIPSDIKIMFDILDAYKETKSILGVCLGHQAIAEYFGATLLNMPEVNHGREFKTKIISPDYLYKNIPSDFFTGRYHSWIVSNKGFPSNLEITSVDSLNKNIMSLKHKELNIRGVQFHPESIMTKYGSKIIENWVSY